MLGISSRMKYRHQSEHDRLCGLIVRALGPAATIEKMLGDPLGRHGYADVFYTHSENAPPTIIEVKTRFEPNPVGGGIRQLQHYHALYNGPCNLWLATGFELSADDRLLLRSAAILGLVIGGDNEAAIHDPAVAGGLRGAP